MLSTITLPDLPFSIMCARLHVWWKASKCHHLHVDEVCATVHLNAVGLDSKSASFQMFSKVVCLPEGKFAPGQRG